ncbi:MAG: hypothetical protein AVDCRST_MAG25-143 [uncultured Rubrobacteraceae bacterium]|uniref:Manganese transport protein MntH n=1 Tax=uncultured Rubrobacteraceae bacterium TaxID=349277 RepID=A0A6J4R5F3_9ACTN|nr:MAG: hypothetical protein AVDCRST_MAG25-143 [uncultured Rubrobacteraceae bacterium]
MTFPPMLLFSFDEPVAIVIIYASLGAVFMPFLAITLLWLLNLRVPREFRSGWLSNLVLGVSLLIFLYVAAQELIGALGG